MYDVLLMLHFLGLALAVGTGFANLTLALSARDMEPAARGAFMLRALALGKNGSVGLLLLLISGIGMLLLRGVSATMQWGGGMFHAKLGLVVVLIVVFGYLQVTIKRAKAEQGGPAMARLPMLGRVTLLLGVAIIVTAVLAFH
jgi:uncharacterized membrane protein